MPWGSDVWGRHRWSEREDFYLALLSASMPSDQVVRVFFNHVADNDDELNRLSNWSVTPAEYGGVAVEISSISHPDGLQAAYVDLHLSREITRLEYQVTVLPGKVSDFGFYILEPFNRVTFDASATAPTVVKATPLSARRLEVLFSEEMDETESITDPERYIISPTVRVLRVARIGLCKVAVDLAADMVPDRRYQLVVTP